MYRIGIDIGGTFTDLAAVDDHGRVVIAKCASTSGDPSEGLLDGLALLAEALGTDRTRLLGETERIVHGTTAATNALIERKGAKVGLLTTEGHRDVIEMREGLKDDRYNVRMPPPVPLVPRARRIGVRERMRFDGTVATPLGQRSLEQGIRALEKARVDAVAVCYLHAYRNGAHEQLTGKALAKRLPHAYLSLSSEVLPQIKENERIWTTVVNAYVGPVLSRYLASLGKKLAAAGYRGEVLIMQSHGGVAPMAESARVAAGAVLSGPAGGVAAGRYCATLIREGNLITFDMGGTSTDIALLQKGLPQLTGERRVGIAKVALPSLDIHTLGAGGGSIARVAGSILHVGPESAGADPGPACYGKGGTGATVTDANLVLGYLDPANFLGGRIRLDVAAAHAAIARIATPLGTSPVAAALGISKVVNTNMAEGIKIVSVRRGVDPRKFMLVSFGGAAGLHITEVARLLEIRRVVVPSVAAVFSAWGMLATDLRYELVHSHVSEVSRMTPAALRQIFARIEKEGRARLAGFSGVIRVHRSLDMRYGEQIFEIQVPIDGVNLQARDVIEQVVERFHQRHEELYAYRASGQEVVIVNARMAVVGALPELSAGVSAGARGAAAAPGRRRVYLGDWVEVPVHRMDGLAPSYQTKGPAIFESDTTTVLIREGERVSVTPHGWLDIELG
jgi:N-methylhydantoinase A